MRRALFALLVLAACGRGAPEPVPVVEAASFRDRGVPIGSSLRATPEALEGEWIVSAAFPQTPGSDAKPFDAVFIGTDAVRDGMTSWFFLIRGAVWPYGLNYEQTAPGRFRLPDSSNEYWVLWMDDDGRTAAVGSPDGRLGWIMDRPGQASGDRTAAAREVLEWSGYDVTQLVTGPARQMSSDEMP